MCERVRVIARQPSPQGVSDENTHRWRRDPSRLYLIRDRTGGRGSQSRRTRSGDVVETSVRRFETTADLKLRNDGYLKGPAYRFVAPISDVDREPRGTRDAWRPADLTAEGIERESTWQRARADVDEIGRRPTAQPQRGVIEDADSTSRKRSSGDRQRRRRCRSRRWCRSRRRSWRWGRCRRWGGCGRRRRGRRGRRCRRWASDGNLAPPGAPIVVGRRVFLERP